MKPDEALKNLCATLGKYRRNVAQVPMDELEGKYKVPFDKLKVQLRHDLRTYIFAKATDGIRVHTAEECEELTGKIKLMYESGIRLRSEKIAFDINHELSDIDIIACELREGVLSLYQIYLDKHTCLCVEAACFDPVNPQTPKIYNDVLNKFWSDELNDWREPTQGETDNTVLIYIQKGV